MEKTIGVIGNYYGGLQVKSEDGKYYWGIECYDGTEWDEIPEYLYMTLVNYENERKE